MQIFRVLETLAENISVSEFVIEAAVQWAPKSIAPATFDGGITAYIATIVVIILGMVATAGNYTKR